MKRRGRRPKLDAEQCEQVRRFYHYTELCVAAIARRFKVAPGVIDKIIDDKYTPREVGQT